VVSRQAEEIPTGPAKERFVRRLFDAIAPTYDLMNLVLSAGFIRLWHQAFRRQTRLEPGGTALDVCTGTGDLALILARQVGPRGRVIGVDLSPAMLALARAKAQRKGLGEVLVLEQANALALPYPAGSFDVVSMGFALRNVIDIPAAVREMARVVRPGGRVLNLELSKPKSPWVAVPYFFYFYRLVPLIGRLVERKPGRTGPIRPYTYLPASLVKFPDQDQLARYFQEAGLVNVRYYTLTGGIVSLHVGEKPVQRPGTDEPVLGGSGARPGVRPL